MKRVVPFRPRFNGNGPNGRRLCVWCGTEIPEGRRRWRSQECVKAMQIEHWPAEWRKAVIKRDNGICQPCGFDAKPQLSERQIRFGHWQNLVQADHIVPLIEGGGNKLENGRTLCVPCHKTVTAELARKRKLDRRDVGKPWSRPQVS